jgi:filamentous hemagglutinin family protein
MRGLPAAREFWQIIKVVTTSVLLVVMPVRELLAGDILRRSRPTNSTKSAASGAASATSPSGGVTEGIPSAPSRLARTTQAIQAVRAMQAAARSLAKQGDNNLGFDPKRPGTRLPDVPNGLGAGGLEVDSRVAANASLWSGAGLPQQTIENNQTKVTIEQNSPQAMLNWSSFNIGKETTLTFDQSLGGADQRKWIAFNKVNDPKGIPSQILGSIEAPGQVYVINANGIIFGGSAQINVNTLVASALPINDNLVNRGLLNNPDTQFLFSALPLAAGANGMPAFTPETPATPDGRPGDVVVQPGAQISTPTTADHVGGRVVLIGANVSNEGIISTPDGQTILAAGLQVGLAAHDATDPSLRGLDVYVGAISNPSDPAGTTPFAGIVNNHGLIDVPRGNITIAGATVNQLGILNSTTSVSLNGRIDLLANYNAVGSGGYANQPAFLSKSSGVVTLGPNSIIQILPEYASDATVVGTILALPSQINLQGLAVHLGRDSLVLAPSANISLNAGVWNLTAAGTAAAVNTFVNASGSGQIYLDAGAVIDVQGSENVEVPVSQNYVAVQLNAAQLADSPLLRNGALRGKTIYVDVNQAGAYNDRSWTGTPLADAQGYVNLIQRTVAELTTAGGSVRMSAGESVIMQPGAAVDVSGGWINYQGGIAPVTRVTSAGKTFEVFQATPDRVYDGVSTSSEYVAGYVRGMNGGSIKITAPSMALDGSLVGTTVSGPRQRQQAPAASSLTLAFQAQDINSAAFLPFSPTPPTVVFQTASDLAPADAFALDSAGNPVSLRSDRKAEIVLSPDLPGSLGFGIFSVENGDGTIIVPSQIALRSTVGGAINLTAANMDIQGSVIAPGGNLQFTVYDFSPYLSPTLLETPPADSTRGHFSLGPAGRLDVAGTVGLQYTDELVPIRVDGGKITIKSYSADFALGSVIEASGGMDTSATLARKYGKGGSIEIAVGQDPYVSAITGGQLSLQSSLRAFSGGKGGALSIMAPSIQIGGGTSNPDTLLLTADFFNEGGFASFTLRGLGGATAQPDTYLPGVYIAPGTVIDPTVKSYMAVLNDNGETSLEEFVKPEGLRTSVSLSFGATGIRNPFASNPLVVRGDLVMGEGAVIRTTPQGSVRLSGDTVDVRGSIFAPGGAITIAGSANSAPLFFNQQQALTTVHISAESVLSAKGATLLTPNAYNFRTGSVLAGGRITISGNIVAEAGAVLDVSGISDTLDVAPGYFRSSPTGYKPTLGAALVPTVIESDGGSIVLTGGQQLICLATLNGFAGGNTANGGNLTVASGRFYSPSVPNSSKTPLDITLNVLQQDLSLSGSSAIGQAALDGNGQTIDGMGFFSAERFLAGGFDALALKGTVQFNGPVSITAKRSLSLADGGVIYADSDVHLSAPYIAVGKPFQAPVQDVQLETPFQDGDNRPFVFPPTYGTGKLTLEATSLIDIGALSLQNIGQANFSATGGDIRGNGILEMAGAMLLRAGQIYPPTAIAFTIAAYDYSLNNNNQFGSVTIEAAGTRQLPLSAGSHLAIYASEIKQDGVLRAPLGTIQLGWDGTGTGPVDLLTGATFNSTKNLTIGNHSVTSVSAIDPVTGKAMVLPYGINLNGTSWIDPTGVDITSGGVTAKSIQFSSANIEVSPDAQIDIRGGGDLLAYRWVSGNGGSKDILASSSSFAILPDYQADYAPYAPYNPSPIETTIFGSDAGYVNNTLSVGDKIYLGANAGLPAGTYTLLPARYALLPGAFLVTPLTFTPAGTTGTLPDGSNLVTGYRFNSLNASRSGQPLAAQFEVTSSTVLKTRAEYNEYLANKTLSESATSRGFVAPRLPIDSGQLMLSAIQTMRLDGKVLAEAGTGGLGGLVDISSPQDILIAGSGVAAQPGVLVLDANDLSSFNAGSLLIGGVRSTDSSGMHVAVQTGNVTVDNAGTPLTGPDVILVANNQLTLASGAEIEAAGPAAGKNDTIALTGNGVALRVGTDQDSAIRRSGVDASTQPVMTIGAGAKLSGQSVIIDSTSETLLDPGAVLQAASIAIGSGQISLALTDPGNLDSISGLILSGAALESLQANAQALSLLSYSSIDTYGSGQIGQGNLANLSLHAGAIRGFNQGDAQVKFVAQNILLDNTAKGTAPVSGAPQTGSLVFDANIIRLGANQYRADQFAELVLKASQGIVVQGTGGLAISGNLTLITPLVTGATAAQQTIQAAGNLTLNAPATAAAATALTPGLGGRLTLIGASVTDNSKIVLPSGIVQLKATDGDVVIGNTSAAQIDVGGVAKTFYDQVRYTDAGQVALESERGSIVLAAGSTVNVSAQAHGGDAGSVMLRAANGNVTLDGTLLGSGGTKGLGGTFQLDTGTLPAPSLASLNAALDANGFTESRSVRVRNGDILLDGTAIAHTMELSADNGSILVTGAMDASGEYGGTIKLAASGSVVLEQGARLSVAAQKFDNAGKGGRVFISAGQQVFGNIDPHAVVDIQTGSAIDLSVGGSAGGVLHLRAPQTTDNLDVQINPINGTVLNASRILVEGYQLFVGSVIADTLKASVFGNGTTFAGNSAAIASRLLAPTAVIRPGAEIINLNGDLTLDTTWDLSTFRFGPQSQPGVLTLRAAGNLNFSYNPSLGQFASLSDGFDGASYSALLLPAGNESWSYRLVAGADFAAADSLQVNHVNTGSVLLGKDAQLKGGFQNTLQPAQSILPGFYQTIRTGTGDIEISAGRDIQLLSALATIYTAGTQADPLADFDLPNLIYPTGTALGSVQYSTPYAAQYSYRGGNVTLSAQNDIARYQVSLTGELSADSTKELPTNWLYRRGYIDRTTGQFSITHNGGEVASTTWWVDFSNFFEGVGALGGGNITLRAGRDVSNVDAVIPTNARMPKGTPDVSKLVELGGGDLQIIAGRDINGGVYYVERGQGALVAGNDVRTNPTRAALDQTTLNTLRLSNIIPDSTTWLPTTLFLGKGSFDISARGSVLLGPVANAFLMPQGINNSFWQKTYFTTYDANAAVSISTLTGDVTLKDNANAGSDGSAGSLASWYLNVLLYTQNPKSFASQSQPWLRLVETKNTLTAFSTVYGLMPPTLNSTAFTGDVNLIGSLTLSPSKVGNLDLLAAGAINGLLPNGINSVNQKYQWSTSRINLSDADPDRLPSAVSPLSLTYLGAAASVFQERAQWSGPGINVINAVFENINVLFNESGSRQGTFGVLQTKLALHAPGVLHKDDPNPVRLYAQDGDISGLTLFAGKSTRVIAGNDINDIALYIQNVSDSDVSVVSAGRDIVAYNPNSQLRSAAQYGNNELLLSKLGLPNAGDIQINGPGALEVLAGRNLDLGIGPSSSDGTGLGITSIGNARNPSLSFDGADIIVAAGIGWSAGLDRSALNFQNFIHEFLDPTTDGSYATRYLPKVGALLNLSKDTAPADIWSAFQQLPSEQQNRMALDIFYLVLRDAGRDHNEPDLPGYRNYDAGFAAIANLFPESKAWNGSITLTSREIKTASGGNISLLSPGGQLLVGFDLTGTQPVDQGILTEDGGNISIFTRDDVIVGTSRIFTLRGGNVTIWSSKGDIAAGASSKTVQSAPPTRVLIDPQSGDIQTDLAGLATGGGIGVLSTVADVPPGDVDLIAPAGVIDAGDAGIRVSGNINLAALQVLNIGNIQVQGVSAGVPAMTVSLNASGLQAANASLAATTTATEDTLAQAQETAVVKEAVPSLISVEVLGYGGGEGDEEDEKDKKQDDSTQGTGVISSLLQSHTISMLLR